MRLLTLLTILLLPLVAQIHPLDGLTSPEYFTIYDTLEKAGHAGEGTLFSSILLHPPDKQAVLGGKAVPRQADVVLLREGRSYAARVDITAKRVASFEQLKDDQAPFLASEMFGAEEVIKKDPRIVAALKKRGITDLRTVTCYALPVAYRAIPQQATARIGFGACAQGRNAMHTWGRAIEGLTMTMDMTTRKLLTVNDTEVVAVPTADQNFMEAPERPRPHTTPIITTQPQGVSYRIENGEVRWQNWRFRFRTDQRVGPVLNLVRFEDQGKQRSVLYEAHVSELFVPYMDPADGWNNRAFIDAGQFYATGSYTKPMKPGLDCPATATWFEALVATETGAPKLLPNMACLFERHPESPAWRHLEGGEVYGRPNRQLVLRSAAVIGNYDYIMDWRFDPDGTIEVAVGATGIIETKAVKEKLASGHGGETGQYVAEHTVGVNHDHYFSYRLDFDVDGVDNSFMLHRMVPKKIEGDPARKSIWVTQPFMAKTEKDAVLDIKLEQPSMWMFMNPAVKGAMQYPTAYEVMPGATSKSLMTPDDPTQRIGSFSEHQFYVTPYRAEERYASGTYVTSSAAKSGLTNWIEANRPIANTDIVGWYTLGFHHITRAEDWPVMPTMWHSFYLRPFHFFDKNPVLDLPKQVTH